MALNWLLQGPTVAGVLIGARDESQLREKLGAADWNLSKEQVAKLDAVSEGVLVYPYWHQLQFATRNSPPIPSR
jgi:aryl-alcohol dehydrogenase-like predicted oxidoreductase